MIKASEAKARTNEVQEKRLDAELKERCRALSEDYAEMQERASEAIGGAVIRGNFYTSVLATNTISQQACAKQLAKDLKESGYTVYIVRHIEGSDVCISWGP